MTAIAYMVREDWAQQGRAMHQSSGTIRSWLSGCRTVYAVGKSEKFDDAARDADRETATYIEGSPSPHPVVGFTRLAEIVSRNDVSDLAVVALHPYEAQDCEPLRHLVQNGRLSRLYVHLWARNDPARHWLEGLHAVDLHIGAPTAAADPLQVEACKLVVNEEYHGLSTGNGKAAVIQLLKSFAREGYAPDRDEWLRAYFAAGGSLRHAEAVKRFVGEVRDGKRHRVSQRFRTEIVSLLRERVAAGENFTS